MKKTLSVIIVVALFTLNATLCGIHATENLSLKDGNVITASSNWPDCVPELAFDEDITTKWGSDGVGNLEGSTEIDVDEWIQVTFPKSVKIESFYLLQDIIWSNIGAYEAQYMNKSGDWVTVHNATFTEQFEEQDVTLTAPVVTTDFRIHCIKALPGTSTCNFFEIEIYGTDEFNINETPGITNTPNKTNTPIITNTPIKTNTQIITNTPIKTSSATNSKDSGDLGSVNLFKPVLLICGIGIVIASIIVIIIKVKKK